MSLLSSRFHIILETLINDPSFQKWSKILCILKTAIIFHHFWIVSSCYSTQNVWFEWGSFMNGPLGVGEPWAAHVRLTTAPSLTTRSGDDLESIIDGGTTTSKYPRLLLIGSVLKRIELSPKFMFPTTCKYFSAHLIWHMYHPLSDFWTFVKCSCHCLWSWWDKDTLWFRVITLLCIVSIVWVSTRTQAT